MGTARAAVDEVAGLRAGRLDLVCLPTLAVSPVADLIGRFRTAHPMVAVRLVDVPHHALDPVRIMPREIGPHQVAGAAALPGLGGRR